MEAGGLLLGARLGREQVVVLAGALVVVLLVADDLGEALAHQRLGHVDVAEHDGGAELLRVVVLLGLHVVDGAVDLE